MNEQKTQEVTDWIEGPLTQQFLSYIRERAEVLNATPHYYFGEPAKTAEANAMCSGGVQELMFVAGLLEKQPEDLVEVFGE